MAQFAVHKKGFFYTDECFVAEEGVHGSIVDIFDNLDDARRCKHLADIEAIQGLGGENIVDFFFDNEDYDKVYTELERYYKEEFDLTIEDQYYFDFPSEISQDQAQHFLDILGVDFHDIVEYTDDETLDEDNFKLSEDLAEF